MTEAVAALLAEDFTEKMVEFHAALLRSNDEEARNAVIVKMVALVALAFGIPAVRGEPLDVEEAIEKLRSALEIIERKENRI